MAKLVECIPNFSVSRERDPAVFQALEDLANSIPGARCWTCRATGTTTAACSPWWGPPGAMEEAALRLAKQAAETIDMTKHTGQHPRMGAVEHAI